MPEGVSPMNPCQSQCDLCQLIVSCCHVNLQCQGDVCRCFTILQVQSKHYAFAEHALPEGRLSSNIYLNCQVVKFHAYCVFYSSFQGQSKHYAFAEYALPEGALAALRAINRNPSAAAAAAGTKR